MEKTNANDLVNPAYINNGHDDRGYTHDGLTKREYFAAMALQGLIMAYPPKLNISENLWSNVDVIATLSTTIADALIEQLSKPTGG